MKKFIIIVLCGVSVLLLRYDFTYNLLPYEVRSSDTLWTILDSKIFRNSAITGLSIEYLKHNNPEVDWNYLQANRTKDDGYTISVFMGRISIVAPNKQYIAKNVALLPENALWNHVIQIAAHDIVILSMTIYAYASLRENGFRITPDLIGTLIVVPVCIALIIPMVLFLIAWIVVHFSFLLDNSKILIQR